MEAAVALAIPAAELLETNNCSLEAGQSVSSPQSDWYLSQNLSCEEPVIDSISSVKTLKKKKNSTLAIAMCNNIE